jgi:hypothetical protein
LRKVFEPAARRKIRQANARRPIGLSSPDATMMLEFPSVAS